MLLEAGRPIADRYVAVADGAAWPESGTALVSLARFLAEPARNEAPGVVVPPAVSADDLARVAAGAAMVAVQFPKFRDGRGFTVAHRLRERHGFAGEIRAVGHVLPDQYRHLTRCGFSTVELADDADLGPWRRALERFTVAYQHGLAAEAPLAQLRRRVW